MQGPEGRSTKKNSWNCKIAVGHFVGNRIAAEPALTSRQQEKFHRFFAPMPSCSFASGFCGAIKINSIPLHLPEKSPSSGHRKSSCIVGGKFSADNYNFYGASTQSQSRIVTFHTDCNERRERPQNRRGKIPTRLAVNQVERLNNFFSSSPPSNLIQPSRMFTGLTSKPQREIVGRNVIH